MSYSALFKLVVLACALLGLGGGLTAFAQTSGGNDVLLPSRDANNSSTQPRSIKEYLAKQRAEKAKKDHEELLKRGDEAVELAEDLEMAFARSQQLTEDEKGKLESMEKLVTKIRKELGGDDDDESDPEEIVATPIAEKRPADLREAFVSLKKLTVKLVDELKRSSRFTISAVAIQSSNSVLKLVRFLRFKR